MSEDTRADKLLKLYSMKRSEEIDVTGGKGSQERLCFFRNEELKPSLYANKKIWWKGKLFVKMKEGYGNDTLNQK